MPVDLAHSLHGGQAFLWRRDEEAYVGLVEGAPVRLRQDGPHARLVEGARAAVERYLRIEHTDDARRGRLARDPVLAGAMRATPGLRLLRQDPWETTVAFLTSANNNVLRIEGILRGLVATYGEPVGAHGLRAFPAPERLARATEARLRALGLGYRAPFLRDTARAVARGDVDLAALRGASREEAREALVALPGIGPKVADCIALFALDVDDAFPVDRWVLRAMERAFDRAFTLKDAAEFARGRWGADAGLAQQYLFHAVRLDAAAPGTARVKTPPMKG